MNDSISISESTLIDSPSDQRPPENQIQKTHPSILQRAVRNSIFNGIGTISTLVIGFVFAGLTIRYLGSARAGYLLSLQTLLGLTAMLGGFGLGTPAVRRVAALYLQGDLKTARDVIGSVSVATVAPSLILGVVSILLFELIFSWSQLDNVYKADAYWATVFVSCSFVISQLSNPWQSVYQATQRYEILTAVSTLYGLVSGIVGIIVLSLMPTMMAISVSSFILALLRLVSDAFVMRFILGGVPKPTWNWKEIRPMLTFSIWTFLGTIGGFMFSNIDRLVLVSFLGSAAMPAYLVPQRLYSQVHGTLTVQLEFLFPMLSTYGHRAANEAHRLEDRLRWFVAITSGIIYAAMYFIGPLILSRLVSPAFSQEAQLPWLLMCVQGLFHAQMIVPYYISWATGHGAPNTVAQIVNGMLVLLTLFILLPNIGVLGASIAQLWICVIFIGHSVWIRKLVSPRSNLYGWSRAYLTPLLFIFTFVALVELGLHYVPYLIQYPVYYLGLIVICGLCGLLLVWLIEITVFRKYDRWQTMMRAMMIPVHKLSGSIRKR